MTDAATGLSILHVIVRAGPTNSQYNEHCLPVVRSRLITVCSLFPATVDPPSEMTLYQGDGTVRGCFRVLRRALAADGYDVVHVHAAASGLVTLLTYLRLRRPCDNLVFTLHNSWKNFRPRNRLILRMVMAFFPLVVACGQSAFDSLPARLRRLYGNKMTVVPNGVDIDRVDRAQRRTARTGAQPEHQLTVVSVNRLIPLKHPFTTVEAFARARGEGDRLVLVGDGPLRREVEARGKAAGVEADVELAGIIPRDAVYRRLFHADLFVSTSGGEGLPVALLEAMACGLPVVVSDIPPHREVAAVAGGFPLVPVGDVEQFARVIERFRTMTRSEREELGRRLRDCVVDHYSVRSMNEAYGKLYAAMVPPRKAGGAVLDPTNGASPWQEVTFLDKLRRRAALLVVLTVLGAAAGFGYGSVQSPVFKGETTLQVGRTVGVGLDEDSMKASVALATRYADLTRREPVLSRVADAGFADSWRDLQGDVFSQVGSKNPQLVQISAYAGDRKEAGLLAAAVADSLVREARNSFKASNAPFLRAQLDDLEEEITTTRTRLAGARDALKEADGDEASALRSGIDRLEAALVEQRKGFAELVAFDSTSAGTLALMDPAWTTRSPLRPTPVVLALAGAGIGAAIAAGWAHLFGRTSTRRRPLVRRTTASPGVPQTQTSNGRASASSWATPTPH